MTFFAISLLIAFVLLFGTLKKIFELNILSPPMVMILLWSSFITIGLLVFHSYPWNYLGLIWLMCACLSYMVGYVGISIYGKSRAKRNNRQIRQLTTINIRKAKILLGFLIGLAFTYTIIRLSIYGVSPSVFFDIGQLAEINNTIAVARYSGEGNTSLVLQVLLAFVYTAPILGGFILPYMNNVREKFFCLSSLLPVLLAFSVTNEKATFIVSVFFLVAGFITGYINKHGEFPKLRKKYILISVIVIGMLMGLLISSMMLRVGAFDTDTLQIVIQKIGNSYAFSHMPAFDHIFPEISDSNQLTWGQYTFYSIADFLNLAPREQGIYQDYFIYQDINTNIYTAFRGMILDYGVIGALMFQFIVGVISGLAMNKIIAGKQSSIAIVVVAASYAFILFSFAVSLFSYMSLAIALVIFVVCAKYMLVRTINA